MPKVLPTFITLFNRPGIGVEINEVDAMVNEPIQFTEVNYTCMYAIIRGVHFTEDVHFDKVPLGNGVKFENCRFDKQVFLENCTALGYAREFNSDSVSVYFNNCNIYMLNIPTLNRFERGVKIFNKSVISDLNIEGLLVTSGSLRIDDSTILNGLRVSNIVIEKGGEIAIVKSSIKSNIRFENVVAGSIGFLSSDIDGDVYVWAGKTSSFVFNNGKFADDFNLIGIQSDQTSIIGADFTKQLTINLDDDDNDIFGHHKKIFLVGNKFGVALELNGPVESIEDKKVEGSQNIEELTIACNRSQDGTIQLSRCQVNETIIKGNLKNGNIRFDSCEFENFHISDFTNAATVSLVSCKAMDYGESLFEIENSNVGKLELLNCSLSSFSKIRLADSLIIDIVSMGVDWFDDAKLLVAANKNDHRGRREVYRQLKQVCEKQGDRIQALEFQSLELSSFRMGLRIKDKWRQELVVLDNADRTKKLWYDKDRWILRFSTTNDFGLHWSKPIWWILGLTTFVFFPLIVACASPELNVWPATSLHDLKVTRDVLWKHIDVLPQLFNPARWTFRLFPDANPSDLGFGTHFWDGLQRIVLAFFIVQIVSAFRKYVKN